MSDNFNMANLAKSLTIADRDELFHSYSLLDDPIFAVFRKALLEGKTNLPEDWQRMYQHQIYPEPARHLLPISDFCDAFHASEPGDRIDYNYMRETLQKYADFIPGGRIFVREIYSFMNELTNAHVRYIRASVSMSGWMLYHKMLDRFYCKVPDARFEAFVRETTARNGIVDRSAWPNYKVMADRMVDVIQQEWELWARCHSDLERLKTSSDFKSLTINLQEAARLHSLENEKTARRIILANQCVNVSKSNNTEHATIDRSPILLPASQHHGKITKIEHMKRKLHVSILDYKCKQSRIKKNDNTRRQNKSNIHQLGNMARTPLSQNVVLALSNIQESNKADLFDDDHDDVGDLANGHGKKSKKVGSAAASATVASGSAINASGIDDSGNSGGVNPNNIHLAMQIMHVEDIEALEQKMNEQEPLGGVIVGEGFNVFNLPPGIAQG